MKPEADHVLRQVAAQLITEIAPHVTVPYGKSSAEVMAMLLIQAAEEYDRAADVRAEENREMRRLFREAAPDVPDDALRRKLEEAAAGEDRSLRVSALNEVNDRLRALLIELHVCVEERDEPWARRVNRAIWDELRASAQRRAFTFFPG